MLLQLTGHEYALTNIRYANYLEPDNDVIQVRLSTVSNNPLLEADNQGIFPVSISKPRYAIGS